MPEAPRKIIITGTGRAGTTFLVRLLTELGLETGFTRDNWRAHVHDHCSAGMEKDITAPDAPRIVKDPDLCERLPGLLAESRIVVEHALVPVRDLDAAAASRVRIGAEAPGGLVGTNDPAEQRSVLAQRFHRLVETLVANEIPHTFLHFPRFATDAAYCFAQLRFLLGPLTFAEFQPVFSRVSDPTLVHDFTRGASDIGAPARAFRAERDRRRRRRRWRRIAIGASAVLLLATVGWIRRSEANVSAVLGSNPKAPRFAAATAESGQNKVSADWRRDSQWAAAVRILDADGDGQISEEEIRSAMSRSGESRRGGAGE